MPIGVIIDALSVVIGGFLGSLLGSKMSADLKQKLNLIFSVCAMSIGISAVVKMVNLPAVILSVVLGGLIGLLISLGKLIDRGASGLQSIMTKTLHMKMDDDPETKAAFITALVLFCASGTGIFGTVVSGISGDHSILIAKAVLDLFTAAIFACSLGSMVSSIAIPQFLLLLVLFFFSKSIGSFATDTMLNDFKACGGVLMVATGLRMAGIKSYPIADMIPAMVLVMPLSKLWTDVIAPLIANLA